MVEKTPDIKKEDKDSEKSSKKLGFSSSRLELKKTIGGGTVRQSFSHGRTKSVSVEVKKVRTYKAYDTSIRDATNKSDNKDMQLSDLEKEARLKAINNSIKMKEIDEKEKKEELIDKPENIPSLVSKIVEYVIDNNLDGVDVDLEWQYVTSGYSNFVINLNTELDKHSKIISAALPGTTKYTNITADALQLSLIHI